jgi:AraC-like DNA-binding protein
VPRAKKREARALPVWLARQQGLLAVLDVLRFHVPIDCSLVEHLPGSRWTLLFGAEEQVLGIAKVLDPARFYAHTTECVRRVVASRTTFFSGRGHFRDLTIPVLRGRSLVSVICAGPFLTESLSGETLAEQWQLLGGSPPGDHDASFRRFVRQSLTLPVLNPEALLAFRELMEIFSALLRGARDPVRLTRRVDALRVAVFSKLLVSLEKRVNRFVDPIQNRGWSDGLLFTTDKEELGLEHMPNVVFAVSPRASRRQASAVAELAAGRELQRKAAEFARTLPETLAGPIETHGMLFLTHVGERRSRAARNAHVQGLVDRVLGFLERESGEAWSAGIGRMNGRGNDLPESTREATSALRRAVASGQSVARHEAGEIVAAKLRAAQTGIRLVRLFEQERFAELRLGLDAWVAAVLEESTGSVGLLRAQVEWLLAALTDIVARRAGLEPRVARELEGQLFADMDASTSAAGLLDALRGGVTQLARSLEAPPAARTDLKLDRAARYAAEACSERLTLDQVARHVGISRSYFSELFKRTYGQRFSDYLREQRLSKAKLLLRTTDQSVNQVATQAGFGNVASFHRAFHRFVGTTPGDFRVRGAEWRDRVG